MHAVLQAYGRALVAQLHGRMLLLSILPFVLSLVLWAVLLWLGLQPLVDALQGLFVDHDGFKLAGGWLSTLGLGALKMVLVPLTAMLLLLPLMVLTALVFIGLVAMPAIVRHVGSRHYPGLDMQRGGSLLGSVGTALAAFGLFIVLWLMALPLYLFPPLALAAQVALWGWLTSRVMAYDALADYASIEERQALVRQHRLPLLAIGVASGLAGALPGIVWVGGAVLSVVLFPFLAAISIWLYVMIFIFTGLWFQFYCLQALQAMRLNPPMKDL
jgi:hypothetical protein